MPNYLNPSEIGNRIRALRKQHNNMKQEQLADLLDVSQKHVSEVERGLAVFSLDKMILAAKILDTDLDYLILGKINHNFRFPLPETIEKILQSGSEEEIQLLISYLQFYVRLRNRDFHGI